MSEAIPEVEDSESNGRTEELRVKNVSEINGISNGTSEDVGAQSGSKRKLPAWMITANGNEKEDETQNKRSKIVAEGDNRAGGSDEASSSKVDSQNENIEKETDKNDSLNQNDDPTSSNGLDASTGESNADRNRLPVIKTENDTDEGQNLEQSDAASSNDTDVAGGSNSRCDSNVKIKHEPDETGNNASTSTGVCSTKDIKPALKVEKADATSSSRESCKFGIRCYRQNPMHRIEEAHPGDHDYKRPHYPPPPDNVPDCPYGNLCYRRNPTHFQQFKHPDDTDFQKNYHNYRLRQRRRRQQQQNNSNDDDASDLDEYDLDDPFIDDDSDLDYVPSDEEENTEELDYDDCDKAEE